MLVWSWQLTSRWPNKEQWQFGKLNKWKLAAPLPSTHCMLHKLCWIPLWQKTRFICCLRSNSFVVSFSSCKRCAGCCQLSFFLPLYITWQEGEEVGRNLFTLASMWKKKHLSIFFCTVCLKGLTPCRLVTAFVICLSWNRDTGKGYWSGVHKCSRHSLVVVLHDRIIKIGGGRLLTTRSIDLRKEDRWPVNLHMNEGSWALLTVEEQFWLLSFAQVWGTHKWHIKKWPLLHATPLSAVVAEISWLKAACQQQQLQPPFSVCTTRCVQAQYWA